MRLYQRPISVTFHANCCSAATVISALLLERPRVRFRHEALVEGYLVSGGTGQSFAWSTSTTLNAAAGSLFRSCELRAWSEDDDRDGRPEMLQFALQVPLDTSVGERLYSISVLFGVEFVADDDKHAKLELNGTLHANYASAAPGSFWRQRSELRLSTQNPVPARTRSPPEPCDRPFWMLQSPVQDDGHAATIGSTLDRYYQCNDTVRLDTFPAVWTPGAPETFEAQLSVSVPRMRVYYTPTSAEAAKFAWSQYLAFFIPLSALVGLLHAATIEYSVVATRAHHPLKRHAH